METIIIEIPLENADPYILKALLESKKTLIIAALGENGMGNIPIEVADDNAKFEWLRFGADSEVIKAWSAFLCAAVKTAKESKRITAKDKAVENDKYAFRCFLLRLGFVGAEHKETRKILLKDLTGSSAFKAPKSEVKSDE